MSRDPDAHYRLVIKLITDGTMVPLPSAGVKRRGRPAETVWQRGQYLSDGKELAAHLAAETPILEAASSIRSPTDNLQASQIPDTCI